jgi:hypothetical protein
MELPPAAEAVVVAIMGLTEGEEWWSIRKLATCCFCSCHTSVIHETH